MNVTHRLTRWWRLRDARERLLLGTMCVLVGAFVAWYAVWLPARHWRDAAQRRHDQAAAELLTVRQELSALHPAGGSVTVERLLASATTAGVAVARQHPAPGGTMVLEIDAVDIAALFAWLDTLRGQGIAPASLEIQREDARLRARAGFVVRTP